MAVLESYIEKKVCDHGKKTGYLVRKLSWIGTHGAPDRFFVKPGRLLMIEFKAPGKKPTKHQEREINRLREAGVEVHIVDNVDAGIDILDRRPNRRESDFI